MSEKKLTHEEKCPVKGIGKWINGGQAILPHGTGRSMMAINTVICQECSHVKITMTEVELPSGPSIAVPQVQIKKA